MNAVLKFSLLDELVLKLCVFCLLASYVFATHSMREIRSPLLIFNDIRARLSLNFAFILPHSKITCAK